MNQTSQQAGLVAEAEHNLPPALPPRCHPVLNGTAFTNDTDSALYHHQNTTVECLSAAGNEASRDPRNRNLKTYHMQPRRFDDSAAFYSKYDPNTGIRTASILGSCLFLVVIYGLYKTKCRKKEWTSQDQMFVENYKKRFNGRKGRRGTDFAFIREPFQRSGETSIAMEQTAKWIQSQPLHGSVQKNNFKSTMGNLCMDSFKASMYPVCDTNNINQMPNGKVKEQKQESKNEIQRLNERNLKLDLQVAYKDMFPFKQNLWKSRSYDDKVNMQTISTLGSLCPDTVAGDVKDDGATKYPLSPQIVSSRTGTSPSLEGADVGAGASAGASSPLPVLHTLCPPSHSSLTSFANRPFSHSDSLIPMIDDPNAEGVNRVAAFHIGTPSSCSSLEQDECFSLTTSPLPTLPVTIIPPLPPYVPPKASSVTTNTSEIKDTELQTVAATKL